MKVLNVLIFLLIFNTFILLRFLVSEADITGKAVYERIAVNMTRAIDGDTFVYETGNISQSVRMLGINTQIG
ncbi:MAG: hypothetical protein NTZ83_02655 [Candidatus Pacearchaeota archaeon]|nr:hypothetical protein [Candidatus Pacearchaeota archaeon]MCX6750331.1 hypothetical protein [Candidatus Pacearchaeota archaeon]